MDLSRPSKYPRNEPLVQILSVPNRADKLTCLSITFKYKDYDYYSITKFIKFLSQFKTKTV